MTANIRSVLAMSAAVFSQLAGGTASFSQARPAAPLPPLTSSVANASVADDCASFIGKRFGNAVVLTAQDIAIKMDLTSSYGGTATIDRPMCRIQAQIQPTPDSDIRFEVWLPAAANWNHYYEATGGGGNSGTFSMGAMQQALEGGYAVSGQDNGHVGRMDDSTYAIGHPEKVIDFGWRSLHEVALASKAIITRYYAESPQLSLFNGCSTGGRQALALAQLFPSDYNGISAGAPANDWPALNAIGAKFGRFLMDHPESWVSPAKLLMVQDAVLKKCGAIDGIIDDPEVCKLDVASLKCTGASSETCLTGAEVAGLKARYADLVDVDGKLLYPGYTQGAEVSLGRMWFGSSREGRWYTSGAARMPEGFFRDYVVGRSDWTIRNFEWKPDLQAARVGVIGKAVAAENPDLSAFAGLGGKLIQWHGWHDMAIPSPNSVRYRNAVVEKMGRQKAASFYRLFMGTGVDHCGRGPGPDSIGGPGMKASSDPQFDVMAALIHWIKDGKAPEQIIATRYSTDGAIVAQRPWCAYPAVARWDRTGDRNKAGSYSCPAAVPGSAIGRKGRGPTGPV